MKISKVFLSSFSIFFSLSCANTFGVKKFCPKKKSDEQSSHAERFTCVSCEESYRYNAPFFSKIFSGCKFKNDLDRFKLCRFCISRLANFTKLDKCKRVHNYEGSILTRWYMGCMFCNINNRNNLLRIKMAFNSQLNLRTKSFIYKVAKFHDRKNNTNIAQQLHSANPDYFDLLDDISLLSDTNAETWEFFASHEVVDELGNILDKPNNIFDITKEKKCRNCKELKEVNTKKFCTFKNKEQNNKHDGRLCENCLGKVIDSNFKCPSCATYIKYSNPLPNNFELKFN